MRILFLVTILLLSLNIFAEEKGGSHGEAKPADGHGGGDSQGEKKADPHANTAPKLPEWAVLQTKLEAARTKVSQSQSTVKSLIEQKEHASDPEVIAKIMMQLSEKHKDYRAATQEYEKLRLEMKYRFPEKGLKGERTYERIDTTELQQMEYLMSLDGKLKRAFNKMKSQYSPEEFNQKKKKINKQTTKDDLLNEEEMSKSKSKSSVLIPANVSK